MSRKQYSFCVSQVDADLIEAISVFTGISKSRVLHLGLVSLVSRSTGVDVEFVDGVPEVDRFLARGITPASPDSPVDQERGDLVNQVLRNFRAVEVDDVRSFVSDRVDAFIELGLSPLLIQVLLQPDGRRGPKGS